MERIIELIKADSLRIEILNIVASLNLPDCYVAAGFVRNLVWDHLHNYTASTLNDIDVVFYSRDKIDENLIVKKLAALKPNLNWQVKNQAFIHLRNLDAPYKNTVHAMEHWPELETAIGARINKAQTIEIVAPFGVDTLFAGLITHNPKRSKAIFDERVKLKNWLTVWPKLKINFNHHEN